MASIFDTEAPKFYRDMKGRFATKEQSEIDFWKKKYLIEKTNKEYFKRFYEQYKKLYHETTT
jgi:hypothetical protein